MGGWGASLLSPSSMENKEYSVVKSIKKAKIPNRARENCSLVFGSLKNYNAGKPFKEIVNAAPVQMLSLKNRSKKVKTKRVERKAEYEAALSRIKAQFTPESVSKLGKKGKRKFKHLFTDYEWPIFCWYVKSCRRGHKRQIRKVKKHKVSTRQIYDNFINSSEWAAIKNRYWRTHSRTCAVCSTSKYIHLHHMVYGQFGQEKDDDLIPLCREHHDEYHAQNGTQRNMKRRTMEFIQQKLAKPMLSNR